MVLFSTFALYLIIAFVGKDSAELSRAVFFFGAGASFAFMFIARLPTAWIVKSVLGRRFLRQVLLIDKLAVTCPDDFESYEVDSIGISPDVSNPIMLHNFSSLVSGADRVVVSCEPEQRANWSMYLRGAGCNGELLLPELDPISPVHTDRRTGWIGIRVSVGPLDLRNRVLKRAFDLSVAVPAIVLFGPFLMLIAIAIKIDSIGPVLFRQKRMGQGNQLFDVFKFRSMIAAASDADGHRSTGRVDDRITRVGRVLRSTSIDELPQLFNVLRGEMSLVGPRPHALGSTAGNRLFWQIDERYWLRHTIKPGITGLAQVRGFRGATDHADDLTNRLQSDLEYVSGWSLAKDLSILFRTAAVVVHPKAY